MKEAEIISAVRDCFSGHDRNIGVYVYNHSTTVRFSSDVTVAYDSLLALSKLLNTTDMNFVWSEGWEGTEVTPGDPPDFYLEIGVGSE